MKSIVSGLMAASVMLAAQGAGAATLNETLAVAYQNNPTLRAKRAGLRAINEQVPQALSEWRPDVSLDASIGKVRQTAGLRGANRTADPTVVLEPNTIGATFTQSVFNGFRTLAGVRRAKSAVSQGRSNLRETEQEVLLQTVTAYMDVVRDEAVLDLNRSNVAVLRRQLEATRDRFTVGEITRTDVAQSEAALSNAIAVRTLAEAQLTASRAEHQRVVGETPVDLVEPEAGPAMPATSEEALEIALGNNPTLLAARFAEESADHQVKVAGGGLLPTVDLQGRLVRSQNPNQFVSTVESGSIFAQLNFPLYRSGRTYSELRQAKQQRSQRMIEMVAARRLVEATVASAWASNQAIKRSIESREDQVRANEIALEGVRQEALVGSRTTLDVLDAEQTSLNSHVELVRSRRDQVVAEYQLLSALGGLTARGLGLDVEIYNPDEYYRDVKNDLFGLRRLFD